MTQSKPKAAASWLATSDAVLRGLNHEFSNRLSLARLAPQLSALAGAREPDMVKLADDSGGTEELFQLLRLYRLMVFETAEPAEPILLGDAFPDAITLFKHHVALRDLEVGVGDVGAAPPVLMTPSSLTQALLLLLCAAARAVEVAPGDTGSITVEFTSDADAVHITARGANAVTSADAEEASEFPALRYLVRDVEGRVTQASDGVTLSLATLVRLRRREKRG